MLKTTNERIIVCLGIVVSLFSIHNSCLVYDDVFFPAISQAMGRQGWFKGLLTVFCLDLPNEYRTYGISRSLQYILCSVGLGSAGIYSLWITASQTATAIFICRFLTRINQCRAVALSSGVLWLVSPFSWTTCFHHYSYILLPAQAAIIGSYFLRFAAAGVVWDLLFPSLLGIAIGLTGELHLLAAPIYLLAIGYFSRSKPALRRTLITLAFLGLSVVAHFAIWKIFAADHSGTQRFRPLLDGTGTPTALRIEVALLSIFRTVQEQISAMIAGNQPLFICLWFLLFAVIASCFLAGKRFLRDSPSLSDKKTLRGLSILSLACSLAILAVYFVTVTISDTIPQVMPRRYGYVAIPAGLLALLFSIFSMIRPGRCQIVCVSILISGLLALGLCLQGVTLPSTIRADECLLSEIRSINSDGTKRGVLFFDSGASEFPAVSADPATRGPHKASVIASEVTQARFGTFWPAQLAVTQEAKIPYGCFYGGLETGGLVKVVSAFWQHAPKTFRQNEVIYVANTGWDARDPFGRNVMVFRDFDSFFPYAYGKAVIPSRPATSEGANVAVIETFPPGDPARPTPGYNTTIPVSSVGGWIKECRATSEAGRNEFHIGMSEREDVLIDLDFKKRKSSEPGKRRLQAEVSWDNGPYVGIGEVDQYLISRGGRFSIELKRQAVEKFSIRLTKSGKDSPDLARIEIRKGPLAPSPN